MVGRIREIVFEDGVDVDGIAEVAASIDYVDDAVSDVQSDIDSKIAGMGTVSENRIVVTNGTTGKALKQTSLSIDSSNNVSGANIIRAASVVGKTPSSQLNIPAGSTADRASAVNGDIRYNTDTLSYEGYNNGAWKSLGGGGLLPTPIDKNYATALETGKHYLYNGAGMTGNVTLSVQAVAAESVFKVTVYNIPTGYKLILDANASETFRKDDTDYTTVDFVAAEVEQSAEFVSNNTAWLVDDGSNALGTVWGGALTVTGAFTPQGGIVGKTDGVAVASGYVGEILGTETAYTNLKGYNYYSEIKCNNSTTLLSISVSKGLYLVNVACVCATGAAGRGMSVKLVDASDTLITAVTQSGSGPITAYDYLTGSFSIPLLITSNTTLYVKGSCYNSTDGGTLEARLTFTRANLIRFM